MKFASLILKQFGFGRSRHSAPDVFETRLAAMSTPDQLKRRARRSPKPALFKNRQQRQAV